MDTMKTIIKMSCYGNQFTYLSDVIKQWNPNEISQTERCSVN